MRKSSVLLLGVLGATGCPEPIPVDENSMKQPSPVQEQGEPAQGPGTQVMGAPAAAAGEGGPMSAGTFGDVIPESELEPKHSQEELASDGIKLSGELVCDDCTGKLLVRMLPPPPEPGEVSTAAGDIQLITSKVFDGPGAFELFGPAGVKVILQVVDDANSDGEPSSGERMGMSEDGPVNLEGALTGLTLQVGVFPKMPEIDALGNPLGGVQEGPANPTAPEGDGPGAVPEGPPLDGTAGEGPPPGGDAPPPGGDGAPSPEGADEPPPTGG